MSALHLSVYEPDGTTFIAHLPRRDQVQFLDENNGDGSGQFNLLLDDQILTDHPTLLAAGNVIKVRPTYLATPAPFGWRVEELAPAEVSDTEGAGRITTVQGRGVRCVLELGQVLPETGISSISADARNFDFSSKDGPWRVPADWVAATAVRWDLDTTNRANKPTDWPDTNSYWLWSSDPDVSAPAGRNWFRSEFTLTAIADVTIYATADNTFSLRLNGEEVMTGDTWGTTFSYGVTLPAGTHTLAAWVDNYESAVGVNPGAFLCVAARVDGAGIPIPPVLTRTNTTDWTVHAYAPPVPGWHASQILAALLTESLGRAELGGITPTIGFTDTLDSDGVAWDDIQDTTVSVGDDLLSVLGQITEMGCDTAVTPEFEVRGWKKRGTDRSATIRLLPGRDITAHTPTVRYSTIRNSILVRHGQGWVRVEDAPSVAEFGRRPAPLSAGNADSDAQALQLGQQYLEENKDPQVTLRMTVTSLAQFLPYRDFDNGDVLAVPNEKGRLVPARLMSIAGSEQDGYLSFDLDFYPEP